ncbi:unnamed protein product, partial [marine sediment metagenome]
WITPEKAEELKKEKEEKKRREAIGIPEGSDKKFYSRWFYKDLYYADRGMADLEER